MTTTYAEQNPMNDEEKLGYILGIFSSGYTRRQNRKSNIWAVMRKGKECSKMSHPTKTLNTEYGPVEIDVGVYDLIMAMNCVEGITTSACCEGGSENFELGYVQFQEDRRGQATDFLTHMLKGMDVKWNTLAKAGKLHDMDFYFTIALGDSYIMRWTPATYPYVLKAVKQLV